MKALLLLITSCFLVMQTSAQEAIPIDASALIQGITPLPPTVEELHRVFTVYTRYGEEFARSKLTDPPYLQFKRLVCILHDSAIRAIMKKAPRKDMADSIQYEDERWKLALRPMLGPDVKTRITKMDAAIRPTLLQLFDLQPVFDWVQYYKQDELIKKSYREKVAAVSSESTTATAKAKNQLEEQQYRQQQQLWMGRLDKYSKALLLLQQLLEKIDYGNGANAADKPIVKRVLADVQARALEAHEKLVWAQNNVAISGELTYNSKRIVNMFTD